MEKMNSVYHDVIRDIAQERKDREEKNKTARIHRSLIRRGFDESVGRRVRCSQCQACVVNGIAIHELGCPNDNGD